MKNFGLKHGALAFLLAVASNIIIQFISAFFLLALDGAAYDLATYALLVVIQIVNVVVVISIVKNARAKPDLRIEAPDLKTKNVWWCLLLWFIVFVCSFVFVGWITVYLQSIGLTAGSVNTDGLMLIPALIVTGVLAPIGEELVYRYALLGGLKQRFPQDVAVLLSALAFAVMHFNPHQTVYQLAFGAVLGYVAIKTGNIVYSIAIHSLNNVVVVLLSLLPAFDAVLYSNIIYFIISAIVFVLGVIAVFVVKKKLMKEKNENSERFQEQEGSGIAIYCIAIGICLFMWLTSFFTVLI